MRTQYQSINLVRLGSNASRGRGRACNCGFCLAACPTYQELGQEMDTPRGRIVLMETGCSRAAFPGRLRSCTWTVASGAWPVNLPARAACRIEMISPFRALGKSRERRSISQRLTLIFNFANDSYPGRFRLAFGCWAPGKNVSTAHARALRPMMDLVPGQLPLRQDWPQMTPAVGRRVARVALLTGCAQQSARPGHQHRDN